MMYDTDGTSVETGDRVTHAQAPAVVETIIEGADLLDWNVDGPGFMILCDQCGRVFIEPGSADWEDVAFVCRA